MTTTARHPSGYLLDNAARQVPDRFAALAELYDEPSFRRLREVGVGPGWRCLEVGAGGGSVARWLAESVGPRGVVTATDLDIRWIEHLEVPNLDVIRHDIVRDRLPVLAYDLIHCRLVLTHLPDPMTAIDKLIRSLRPGGWLVLEEFDTSLLDFACPAPRTKAEHRANRIREAFIRLLELRGVDLQLAPRLPSVLGDRGFEQVSLRGSYESGPAVNALERANLEQVRVELLGQGITADELDAHLEALPQLRLLMPVMISTVARKWPS